MPRGDKLTKQEEATAGSRGRGPAGGWGLSMEGESREQRPPGAGGTGSHHLSLWTTHPGAAANFRGSWADGSAAPTAQGEGHTWSRRRPASVAPGRRCSRPARDTCPGAAESRASHPRLHFPHPHRSKSDVYEVPSPPAPPQRQDHNRNDPQDTSL